MKHAKEVLDEMRLLECETCDGTGEIALGFETRWVDAPPEPVYDECPICLGHGKVKAWELEEFDGVFPSEAEAASELLAGRFARDSWKWDEGAHA